MKINVLAELVPAKALIHASLLVSGSLGDSLAFKWLSSALSPHCLPCVGIYAQISLFVVSQSGWIKVRQMTILLSFANILFTNMITFTCPGG